MDEASISGAVQVEAQREFESQETVTEFLQGGIERHAPGVRPG